MGSYCAPQPCTEAQEAAARLEATERCEKVCAVWTIQGARDGAACADPDPGIHFAITTGDDNLAYCDQHPAANAYAMCHDNQEGPTAYDYAHARAWLDSGCGEDYDNERAWPLESFEHLDSDWYPCGADGWPEEPPLLPSDI